MRLRHRKLRVRTTNYSCLCERPRGSLIPDVDPGPRQTVPNRFRRRKNELGVATCTHLNRRLGPNPPAIQVAAFHVAIGIEDQLYIPSELRRKSELISWRKAVMDV